MVFFSPFKKKQQPLTPWYVFLGAAVLLVAFGLKIVQSLKPDRPTPTANIPAISYQDAIKQDEPEVVDPTPNVPDATAAPAPAEEVEPTVTHEPKALPTELNLAVPFTSQAPTGNWDALHEDACEEASMFMVQQFYLGTPAGKIDPKIADPEITRLVHVGESLGQGPSITLTGAKDLLMKDTNATAQILDNPTVEDIKLLISLGKPVIIPAAGRELGNPNFTGAGPLYHMLVIRGYTEDTFITNDPGTRLGENYSYGIDVIMDAIGDWNDGDPVHGAKRILYLDPK
ncbi:MAG TPA: C39 family peptidase [bacterium]|nr:C39 family peptidase [bacterium]